MKTAIIIAVLTVIAVAVALLSLRKTGYRGAIGFKNRHDAEIDTIRLTGFWEPIECRTLARGEHSFNYPRRQRIPATVQIAWRLVGDATERTATVSMTAAPAGATDGELFFVLSSGGIWSVEYAPELQLDKLQRGE